MERYLISIRHSSAILQKVTILNSWISWGNKSQDNKRWSKIVPKRTNADGIEKNLSCSRLNIGIGNALTAQMQ